MQQDVKLTREVSPYIKKDWTSTRIMIDVLIALLPVVVFAIYKFGHYSLVRMVVGIAVAILTEALIFPMSQRADRRAEGFWKKFISRYKNFNSLNIFSAAVTGLILTLQLPSQISYYVLIVGSVVSIAIGKMVFGGTGNNIFNPAAVGRVFVSLTFASFFSYQGVDVIAGATPLGALDNMGIAAVTERYYIVDLLMGNIPGAMGQVSALAIIIGGIYLSVRKVADWKIMVGIVVPFAIFILIAGFAIAPGHAFEFMLYHVLSGGLLFGVVFMATDPVTSPLHVTSKLLFGLLIAGLVVLIRLFSTTMPEGVVFSILFANMITPLLDRIRIFRNRFNWQFAVTYGVSFVALVLIAYFGAGGTF